MKKILHRSKKLLDTTQKKWKEFQKNIAKNKAVYSYLENEKPVLEKKKEKTVIDISLSSVVKSTLAVAGILALIYFLYSIQTLLVLLFSSLILGAAISPAVDKMQTKKIPRSLGVILIYIIFLVILGAIVYSFIPIIVEQIVMLTQNIGRFVNNILSDKNFEFPFSKELKPFYDSFIATIDKQQIILQAEKFLSTISEYLQSIAGNSLQAIASIFNGIFNALLVLVITFFLVVDTTSIRSFVHSLLPSRYASYFSAKVQQMQIKIGGWVRGQLILCLAVGIATYLGFLLLMLFGIDIPYKESLSALIGILEFVPYVGPVLAAVPAILIAMNVSPWAVFWVIILYIIIQQLEGNIIVPLVMNKQVGLNPIVIIVAMLIGAQFFGILGMILAIPISTSISVLVEDYVDKEK